MLRDHKQYGTTIYALSSGGPPSGIAVIRLSGPGVRFAVETLTGSLPAARVASLRTIRDRNGAVLDRGLVICFPAPASFTGEDCAEFHVHGGRAVVDAVTTALGDLPGFRYAEAGEFTRRAFENGKFDLTAVEGLADLVVAETEMQRRLALASADGGLRSLYEDWMRRLTRCRAFIEAGLDFAEEEDVPDGVDAEMRQDLVSIRREMARHLDQSNAGAIVRDGFQVVIAGPPNAGKSSLMNALAKRDIAITSDEAGTTRDVLTVTLDLGGYAVIVRDTAGLRDDVGEVEREGIRRARKAIAAADLVLFMQDSRSYSRELPDVAAPVLAVASKCDLGQPSAVADLSISVVTGEGLEVLEARILEHVRSASARTSEAVPTRLRHRQHLSASMLALDEALEAPHLAPELLADHLRGASAELGRLTGQVGVEDLLDVIFSSFCIGK